MELKGVIVRLDVEIDPIQVVEKLKTDEIGDGYVLALDDKYYSFSDAGGSHYLENRSEITKEMYDYISALSIVLNTLKYEKRQRG